MKVLITLFTFTIIAFMSIQDETVTVEGYLQLFGNEPFPKMAVITEDHGRLFLDITPAKRDSLWSNQRGNIRITGKLYEKTRVGKSVAYITLDEWEWVDD